MDFGAILEQVLALVQRQGRVSYRAITRRFNVDDAYLADLREEILFAYPHIREEEGRGLVWTDPLALTAGTPSLAISAPQGASSSMVLPPSDAERRQLTVLFCDLADSTRLAQQLDPEDLREIILAYQATCVAVIQRFDGYVAQYLGDGLLVYCGYPLAHEDDAQRAVRTALGILEAMATLNTQLAPVHGIRLAVRIGIHTGLVVIGTVGSGDRHEQLAVGDTPNLAARLQGLAAPDTIVLSDATYRLVQGYFTCEERGTHALKGFETPVRVYRVWGASAARSHLEVARATGLTSLVGREYEIGVLRACWERSQEGVGQVVLLSGEAGIGKSRLVEALHERVHNAGGARIVFRCSPYHQHSALYPIIDHFQRILHWHHDDTPASRLHSLEQALHASRFPLPDVVPLFAALLSLPLADQYPPLQLTPHEQREQTQAALVAWLREQAERQPVLVVWEDLHWADPSTLDVLGLLLDQVVTARMLTVLTYRPGFRPPWALRSPLTEVTLSRLEHPHVEVMVTSLTGDKPLPRAIVEQVIAKTDGVPLFVEELVKMILASRLVREEAGHYVLTGPLPPLAIPTTLQDALMARLDRLTTARPLAQLGAVLGRAFSYALLQAVAAVDETTLQQGMAQLVDAEIVSQRGLPPRSHYVFKHALIQETAYHSLLKSTRQQHHQRTAQVLAERFPAIADTQPEVLAQHYTEAGCAQQATDYWQRAGQRANARSAYREAIAHCTKGLEVLQMLPETPARAQHELRLCLTLGTSLIATQGYGAVDVEHVYSRARALCAQGGDPTHRIQVLIGLFVFYELRGAIRIAQEVAHELLTLAQQQPEPVFLLRACATGGQAFWLRGDLATARRIFEQGIALYDPQHHSPRVLGTWQDAGVTCLSYLASTLWLLGYPDQAQARSHQALTLSDTLAHPFTRVWAAYPAAQLFRFLQDYPQAHAHIEHVRTLETTHGFTQFAIQRTLHQGWALLTAGKTTEGMAQLHEGLRAYRAKGTAMHLPAYLARLAEAYHRQGQSEEGLAVLTEALTLVDTTDERWWEAELHRLQGEFLLQRTAPDTQQAERCFQHAIEVARHQQGKALELRAAMSLSRLWQQQGKCTEAHTLLAPLYGWFTEGFDTADLQEAKMLLEELSR